jgi:sugar O-acyltransferase (sialic acid O-acetyltransferase NeuD family)
VGQAVRAGDVLCFLVETPGMPLPEAPVSDSPPQGEVAGQAQLPAGLRITQPALALANSLGIELTRLPTDVLVTESVVRETGSVITTPTLVPPQSFDPTAILVYGGGGHGKTIIELLRAVGIYRIVGVVDDGLPAGTQILGLPVLGGAEALPRLYQDGVHLAVNAVGGIGDLSIRLKIFKRLAETGFSCPAVVHPRALLESSATLAAGVQVFALAYVGSEAHIGYGAIINTGAIVSHECSLGEYANLSPGAILAGQVEVGAGALIGMGATVNLQVKIGANARVGNGATVKTDVPPGKIVRAGSIWPV